MVQGFCEQRLRQWLHSGIWSGPDAALQAERFVLQDPLTHRLRGLGFDLTDRAGERLEWLKKTADLCPRVRVEAAGYEVEARVTLLELWRFYLPLCQMLTLLTGRRDVGRTLLGVAGPGASGKTIFVAVLRTLLARVEPEQAAAVAVCSMDGFHLPNRYLDTHFVETENGRVPLRHFKGAPETFDADGFVKALQRLRAGEAVALPVYDRRIHDPVPGAVSVGPKHRVVVVEGNYLLLERPPWAAIAGLLDLRLFLDAPLEWVREAMVERHMRGGRSRGDAEAHFERTDARNYAVCKESVGRADLLVLRGPDFSIRDVVPPSSA